jgi:hypothetical protein
MLAARRQDRNLDRRGRHARNRQAAAGARSCTPAPPITRTCTGVIGNDFISKDGRSAAITMALVAMERPAVAAITPVTTTALTAAIDKTTRISNLLNKK